MTEYGALVDSVPRTAPSNLNCTPATPALDDAFADTGMMFETVACCAGDTIATVSGPPVETPELEM